MKILYFISAYYNMHCNSVDITTFDGLHIADRL